MRPAHRGVAIAAALILIAGVALAALPIRQDTGDSNVGCGSLLAKDDRQLRRQFCEEAGAYDDRERLVLITAAIGLAGLGVALTVSAARRQSD